MSGHVRNQSTEIGWISRTGYGSGRLARCIKRLIKAEGALVLLVCSEGYVYAVSAGGDYERRVSAQRPGWIVGTFNRDAETQAIVQDLRARSAELKVESERRVAA